MKAQNKTMKAISTSNSRPLRRALCTLLIPIAALWAMPRGAHAQSSFVIAHNGSTDPTTEGFTPTVNSVGVSTTGPIPDDMGLAAWSIAGSATNSQFGYQSGPLSASEQADIASQGFVLTLDARVLQGLAPAYTDVNPVVIGGALLDTGTTRWEMDLGLNSNGDTVVVLPTSVDAFGPGNSVQAHGPSFTLAGSGSSYNTYQLVFNPVTQSANLFVDGIERLQDYTGDPTFVLNRGLVWGALSGGQGNFAFVQVASVPEPSAWSMIAVGGVALLGVMLQRRHRFL